MTDRYPSTTRATPLGRRLALNHGLNLDGLVGSGPRGRITRQDVEGHLRANSEAPMTTNATAPATSSTLLAGHAPTAWMLVEVDLTAVLRAMAHTAMSDRHSHAVDLTWQAVILRAAIVGLGEHPQLNAAWGGDRIIVRRSICLTVIGADAQPRLIPRAEERSLAGLTAALEQSDIEPMAAPTLTVVVGDVTGVLAEPMLPADQAACLIVGPPIRRLVAVDDLLVTRSIASLAVVFDHRVLDGAPIGQFLRSVRTWLETTGPAEMGQEG